MTLLSEIQELVERGPAPFIKQLEPIISALEDACSVKFMSKGPGAEPTNYTVRVKPADESAQLKSTLGCIFDFLIKQKDLSDVHTHRVSPNSSKFSSVSFKMLDGTIIDIVVAAGANAGEKLEKRLASELKTTSTEEAAAAMEALKKIDPAITLDNIKDVIPRKGSTSRAALSPKEAGEIIADLVIILKNDERRLISVKDVEGKTIGQMGIGSAFSEVKTPEHTIIANTDSGDWEKWCAPFDLDPKRIEAGFAAYFNNGWPEESPKEFHNSIVDLEEHISVTQDSKILELVELIFGVDYIYLRKIGHNKFEAKIINEDYIRNTVLKNLKITQIRYPAPERKQVTIYLSSDELSMKLELRNPSGGSKGVKPSQIQLSLLKNNK